MSVLADPYYSRLIAVAACLGLLLLGFLLARFHWKRELGQRETLWSQREQALVADNQAVVEQLQTCEAELDQALRQRREDQIRHQELVLRSDEAWQARKQDWEQRDNRLTLQVERQDGELKQYRQDLALSQSQCARLQEAVDRRCEELQALRQQLQERDHQRNQLQEMSARLEARNAGLEAQEAERRLQHAEQTQALKEDREQLKREFENLANRIFEERSQRFTDQSRESIGHLLQPFRSQLGDFQKKVAELQQQSAEDRGRLSQELKQLQSLNESLTREAHDLSTALRGQKKMQGNWGELMLENVLERSGLRLGEDYLREPSYNTASGRQRPDVVIKLPQNRHLIVDAKVSLNAWQDFVNAETDETRRHALGRHVAAIGDRIRELSDKRYFDLPELNSPEVVFMFVPIEAAFVEALRTDHELFQNALQNNVLVATPTTLLTSLNIVRQLWRFEAQARSTRELADRAGRVYDKVRLMVESLDMVGKHLGKARDSWQKAYDQLKSGRGNLIKQVDEFREFGVAVKKELPPELVEQAAMELELGRERELESRPEPEPEPEPERDHGADLGSSLPSASLKMSLSSPGASRPAPAISEPRAPSAAPGPASALPAEPMQQGVSETVGSSVQERG